MKSHNSSSEASSSNKKSSKKRRRPKGKVAPMTRPEPQSYASINPKQDAKPSGEQKENVEMHHLESAADVVIAAQYVRKGVECFKRCGRRVVAAGSSASKKRSLVLGIDASILPDPLSSNAANAELIGYFGHLAASSDQNTTIDLEYVDMILRRGADINCTDKYGQTALHEVARMWDTDVALFLIERGSRVNQADGFGRMPLHVAAAVDYPEMIKVLLDNGAKLEALTNGENQTPVFYAARNDASDALRLLHKRGAKLHQRDYKGRTPLIVAAELDRSETSRLLLEMGAYASDIDHTGHTALQVMVTKMPAVAKEGLDQLYRCDRANRKQFYDLHLLEPLPLNDSVEIPARTVLQSIVHYGQQELIMHPVCKELVKVKWEKFGRWGATKQLLFNMLFILMWTVLAVSLDSPFEYQFPKDIWRLVLEICGVLLTIYQIVLELKEYHDSKKMFIKWRNWRKSDIGKDFKYCHPQWPQEKQYLDSEIDEIKDLAPTYFSDKWNLFDWGVYIALLIITLLHVVDIFVDAKGLSNVTQNIFALVIIFVWVRLMKSVRAFTFVGPFIVMLVEITKDFAIFVYIYANFFIPYACAFWMTYGGQIPSMQTVDQMAYSLFRITLVDEYDYDGMRAINVWMTYILLVTFLMISAILCINVLIAMLSNTFQRVYDNAAAIALMQQTKIILSIEEGLGKRKKKKYHRFIQEFCSPKDLFYDDDMTTEGGEDLKKMTFRIKDSLAELDEFVREEQHKAHSESIGDLQTEFTQFKQTQQKEMKKITSELKVIQELLKIIVAKPGRLQPLSPSPRPAPRDELDDSMRPTTSNTRDPAAATDRERRTEFHRENRMSRKEREERERYLDQLLKQSSSDTKGTKVIEPTNRSGHTEVIDQDFHRGDVDIEAPDDSLAERVRMAASIMSHVHLEKEGRLSSDEEGRHSSDEEE